MALLTPNQNLDIQYTVDVATGVPTIFISVGDSTTDGFLDIINALNTEPNPPQVCCYLFRIPQLNSMHIGLDYQLRLRRDQHSA